jgi:hypothetical protein
MVPSISIDAVAWTPSGEYLHDLTARLTTRIDVCGTPMYLNAYAIDIDPKYPDDQHVVDQELDGVLTTLVGESAYPLTQTTIAGREYLLIATPCGD